MLDVKRFTKNSFPQILVITEKSADSGGEEEGKDLLTLKQG